MQTTEKPLTAQAVKVLRKMKELNTDFIRRENAVLWYGNSDWMCLYPAGLVILNRRGMGEIRRTPSGLNIEHFQLNSKGRSEKEAV